MVAAGKSVFTVTPNTPHRAARQPDERTGAASMCRFALNRTKDLSNSKHLFTLTTVVSNLAYRPKPVKNWTPLSPATSPRD
jgi:hypothetical protein